MDKKSKAVKKQKLTKFVCDACKFETPKYDEFIIHNKTVTHEIEIARKSIGHILTAMKFRLWELGIK